MARRCPASKPVGVGRLMRHRLFIFDEGYASVIRDPQRTVWGLVWDLALADVAALDRYESLSTGLYTKVVQSILTDKGPRRAMIYVARSAKPGSPKSGYMEGVVEAAVEAGLPPDYIRGLRAWLPMSQEGPSPAERPKVRALWAAPSGTLRKTGEP